METKKEIKEEIGTENLFQDLPLNGYFCHLCTTKFEDYSMLKVHLFFAHENKKAKTEPKSIAGNSNSIPEEKFTCEICGSNLSTKSNLKVHTANVHFKNSETSSISENIKFKCEICLAEFPRKYSMKRHVSEVHDKKVSKELLELGKSSY